MKDPGRRAGVAGRRQGLGKEPANRPADTLVEEDSARSHRASRFESIDLASGAVDLRFEGGKLVQELLERHRLAHEHLRHGGIILSKLLLALLPGHQAQGS